jgi:hypothetical protein
MCEYTVFYKNSLPHLKTCSGSAIAERCIRRGLGKTFQSAKRKCFLRVKGAAVLRPAILAEFVGTAAAALTIKRTRQSPRAA